MFLIILLILGVVGLNGTVLAQPPPSSANGISVRTSCAGVTTNGRACWDGSTFCIGNGSSCASVGGSITGLTNPLTSSLTGAGYNITGIGAYNGLTLTANATGFSVAGGTTSKTLTVSNTLTLAGTDASTLNIGAGGTLGTAAFTAATAYQAALTNPVTGTGTNYYTTYWNGSGTIGSIAPGTAAYVLTSNGAGAAPSYQAISSMIYPGDGVAVAASGAWTTPLNATNLGLYAGTAPIAGMVTFLGSADLATARSNLGVAIGTNVQAYSALLGGLAALTDPSANRLYGWDTTDGAAKFFTLGAGLSYDHSSHSLSASASAPDFSQVTSGTNVQASGLLIGTGGSLGVTGTGTINATSLGGTAAASYALLAGPTLTGKVTVPTYASGTAGLVIGSTQVQSTAAQLNYLDAATGTTGTTSTSLVFSTSPSITTPTINTTLTMADAANIVLNATTGTKIGTATSQKLGFFNTAPVIQQTGDVVTALSNLGLVTTGTVALATAATNSTITNDTTTAATMYPVWVTTTSGNLPGKVSSTKLSFTPSTGILAVTGITGTVNGNTLTAGSSTYTGTAAQTYTFPTTTKTIAANDGSNWTFASQAVGDIHYATSTTAYGRLADVAAGQPLLSGGVATAPAYAGYTFSGTAAATYTFPGSSKTLAASDMSNAAFGSDAQDDVMVRGASAYGRLNLTAQTVLGRLTGGHLTPVAIGTSASNLVQLDTNGYLPAVDGRNLTNLPVAGGALAASGVTALTGNWDATNGGANAYTITAGGFTTYKVSGTASTDQLYNDSTTQLYGVILKGPTGSMAATYTWQYPNAAPTTGQVNAYGTPTTWVVPALSASYANQVTVNAMTSGGLPYGSSSNTLSSTAALAAHGLAVMEGAGNAPVAVTDIAHPTYFLSANTSADPAFRAIASADLPVVAGSKGGTGVANNDLNTLTFAGGNYGLTLTLGQTTNITVPTAATITMARTDAAQSFTGVQTMTSAALTTPVVTTDIHAATVGGATLGTSALPFSNIFFAGAAGPYSIELTGTAASSNKTITFPNSTGHVDVIVTDSTTAGQMLQATATTGIAAYSVPTYPAASGTARKILVSDGTNYVASTETWAVPGATVGNVLTSDGTNWISQANAACPAYQLIDGHGATTALTSGQVACPSMVDNTGQTGASASVAWPTKANNQSTMLSVATTVAATYAFEVDFGSAVAYPDGNHTTAFRYCGFAATNVTEGNYGMAQCRRSSTYGAAGIACDWISGIGVSGCHN